MLAYFFEKKVIKQFRLVLIGLLSLVAIFVALSFIALDKISNKNATTYTLNSAQKFNSEIEHMLSRVNAVFNNLLFEKNIENILAKPYTSKTQRYLNELQSHFSSYRFMNEAIAEIAIVSDELAWSDFFSKSELQDFYHELLGSNSTVCFGLKKSSLIARSKSSETRLIFAHIVRGMHDNNLYGKELGAIILSIDLSKSSLQLPLTDNRPSFFYIKDKNEATYLFNFSSKQYELILEQLSQATYNEKLSIYESRDFLINQETIIPTDLIVTTVINKHSLKNEMLPFILILVICSIITLIAIILLMSIILKNIIKPISKLSERLEELKYKSHISEEMSLDLNPIINSEERYKIKACEEVLQLENSLNSLLNEQTRLTNKLQEATVTLYEHKLGRKQAELDYLRSQINPHFLYNTLEVIKSMAEERTFSEIADASGSLAKLFRYSIQGDDCATLEEELEITKAYLTIQKLRFPDKINIILSIRENVKNAKVMKLLLQPLVENAVYHGLEPKSTLGNLYIGARKDGDDLLISIYDDGIGIDENKLKKIQDSLSQIEPRTDEIKTHIGLMNVQNRIRLHYGENYGITIFSSKTDGTKITLKLPFQL